MVTIMTTEQFKAIKKPKKSKYKSVKCEHLGIKFNSLKERNQYIKYLHLQSIGEILSIKLQPRFDIIINGKFCGFYKADFEIEMPDKSIKIVDVKGMRTTVFNLKLKIIEAMYGIKVDLI